MLVGKDTLNTIEVLFSKALIHWCINHDEFVSVNNVLRGYNEMKEILKVLRNMLYKNNRNVSGVTANEQLSEELHKRVIKNLN